MINVWGERFYNCLDLNIAHYWYVLKCHTVPYEYVKLLSSSLRKTLLHLCMKDRICMQSSCYHLLSSVCFGAICNHAASELGCWEQRQLNQLSPACKMPFEESLEGSQPSFFRDCRLPSLSGWKRKWWEAQAVGERFITILGSQPQMLRDL